MIAVWMLYAVVVAALIGAGAFIAERGARALRWPARWFWAGAMVASLIVPVVGIALAAWAAERDLQRTGAIEMLDVGEAGPAAEAAALPSRPEPAFAERVMARGIALARSLDRPLLAAWALASLAMLGTLLVAAGRLVGARREWPLALIDDHFVRVSQDTGPAVVGIARCEIVLPHWALSMDAAHRAMLLAHEREHVKARDPLLLLGGLVAVVVAPWNPALWWQLRRLRLAVEMDCDARVLRACTDVRAYGALLIEVGRRTMRAPLAAAAFSEPATHLERRIHMMLARPPRRRVLHALTLGTAGLALTVVACDMKAPVAPTPQDEVALAELGANGKSYNVKQTTSGNRIHDAVAEHFPELIGQTAGDTMWLVQFVVDPQGRIVGASKSPDQRLEAAQPARVRLREMPAQELEASARRRPLEEGELMRATEAPRPRMLLRESGRTPTAPGPLAPTGALSRVRADEVESVEVLKGKALNVSDALAGVIWVTLRTGTSRTSW